MGTEKDIIVAIELGSSAIRGIAGQKEADGNMRILAIEQESTTNSVRRGVIYNIDKTTHAIERVKNRIEEKLGVNINRAYVGLSGQSLHTISNKICRTMQTRTKITADLVDMLMDDNRGTVYPDREILDTVPQEYRVDDTQTTEPVGIQCDQIEGRYMNVIARTSLHENIRKCMRGAGLEIAELLISPMELAKSILPDSEKRSGCALVDMGAETTTVSIYTKNILRHLVVIPLGGSNITRDISVHQSVKVEMDEAEKLKLQHGTAYLKDEETENIRQIPISNDRAISEKTLQEIIAARTEEILANVWFQIEDHKDDLLSGIIFTGGASRLRDLSGAFNHLTGFSKIRMAKNLITTLPVSAGISPEDDITMNTAIALLQSGDQNCTSDVPSIPDEEPEPETIHVVEEPKEEEEKETAPAKKKAGIGSWIKKTWKGLLEDDTE